MSPPAAGKASSLGTRLRGDLFEVVPGSNAPGNRGRRGPGIHGSAGLRHHGPEEVWRQGNPSLGSIKSLSYMRRAALAAADDPSRQPSFRAHDLNAIAEDDSETIVSLTDWKQIETPLEDLPPRKGRVWMGFDAGGSASATAAVLLWESGRMEAMAAFPARPSIEERGKGDGVGDLFARMVRRRELLLLGNKEMDRAEFLRLLADRVVDFELAGCGADRYRRTEVVVAAEGTPFAEVPWTWRGTGAFQHGGRKF